jgi:hypothetical protein
VNAAYEAVRALVPALAADRPPAPDIERLARALSDGLLEGVVPEDALAADLALHPLADHGPANGKGGGRRRARQTADREGRGRH